MEPLLAISLGFWATLVGGGFYFVRRYVRAVERRSGGDETSAQLQTRVAALEEFVGTIQRDVERIDQGQEFTTRLLERGPRSAVPPT